RSEIFDYIEMFYNRERRHSHLGGVSPEQFEMASK
ncbi:MAG: IS3 family transposase, partial [Gammaproteobacteria bacterium]|nr:IS3 family transposase [Gammaproteobacteria bacterium]